MSNKDLFKEAIADAKAALEEALAPKLQNTLAAKLQEMDEDLDEAKDKEELDEMELGQDNYATDDIQRVNARKLHASLEENEELEEDFDLSEILAELSEENELEEGKKEDKEEIDEAKEDESEDESEGEDEDESEEEAPEAEDESEGEKITDLTVDELKDIIKDIISSEMASAETPEMDMSADMSGEGGEDEVAVNIDGEADEIAEEEIDEIDLEELLAELDSLDEAHDDDDTMYEAKKKEDKKKKEDEKEKDEMKEALETIETLRAELHEQNLLNAKLLYVNKIFKAKNLNESQKLKVIAQFDKATTAKEAKAIFESMNSAIAKSTKSTIKESLGFASKAAGIAPKKPIVDETMSRWQMLAGITKF